MKKILSVLLVLTLLLVSAVPTFATKKRGKKMLENKVALNEWIRAPIVPPNPAYQGSSDKVCATPCNDIEGAV